METHLDVHQNEQAPETSDAHNFLAGAAVRGVCAVPAVFVADKVIEATGGDFVTKPLATAVVTGLAIAGGISNVVRNR